MPEAQKSVSGAMASPGLINPESDKLALIITRPEDAADCPFWIGIYRTGLASAKQVFAIENIAEVFTLLTEQGLSENQALMLSDNSGAELRQFYLVPEHLCRNNSQEAKSLIIKSVEALRPPKLGLYFGLETLEPELGRQLLEEILISLVDTKLQELYLFTGSLGVNAVLNTALRVKHQLSGSKDLLVYH